MKQWDEAIIIGLGSNLPGDYDSVEDLLEAAIQAIGEAGFKLLARSSWWVSSSWPDRREPPFLNGVLIVEADMPAGTAMYRLHEVENRFGRARSEPNAPRTLDLDMVAYGRRVGEAPNTPHPRAHERRFVMGPLAEIAPDWRHPVTGETARALARKAKTGRDAAPVASLGPSTVKVFGLDDAAPTKWEFVGPLMILIGVGVFLYGLVAAVDGGRLMAGGMGLAIAGGYLAYLMRARARIIWLEVQGRPGLRRQAANK